MLILELYDVVDTCSYHEKLPYSTVLHKINSDKIRENFKANYLVQVWKHGGKKVYEQAL